MPALVKSKAAKLVNRRHPEWVEFQAEWRWLADSLEGGRRYRDADYTCDPIRDAVFRASAASAAALQGWPSSWPLPAGNGVDPTTGEPNGPGYGDVSRRNLIPHLSETGTEGRDLYAMRLARTPVPRTVERAVNRHVSKVFGKEVVRSGPAALEAWWEDVDGRGCSVDDWVQLDAGPMFLTLGQCDLLFDHPPAPEDARVETRADLRELGLDACVVRQVAPEYVTWWRLERDAKTYSEVVFFDPFGRGESGPVYWHWTAEEVRAYRPNGVDVPGLGREHPFGRVPMVRCFDRRLARATHAGRSRYGSLAELQKAIYNGRSELALGDVQQCHALMQGPEDFCQAGEPIPVGPGGILPKRKLPDGGYEGWDFVDPPKGAQQEARQHIKDYEDEADRDAALAKPAGQTTGSTVSQSGISKIADQEDGNKLLASVAASLQRFETQAARMALIVLTDGQATPAELDSVSVVYPRQFDLDSLADVSQALDGIQRAAQQAGSLPRTEAELLKRAAMLALPGLEPDAAKEVLEEIDAFTEKAAAEPDPEPEPAVTPPATPEAPGASPEAGQNQTTEPETQAVDDGRD